MSSAATETKLELPSDFYRSEPAWATLYVVYSFAQFFGFGYASYSIATCSWLLAAKVPAVLLAALLAGNGLHLLGWIAHEGIHLSLVKSKPLNLLLGSFAGAVLLFPTIGFGISHWPHHRFTNDARDPDTALQARQQTFWSRFFRARLAANRQYYKDGWAVLLGKPRDQTYRLPVPNAQLQRLGFASFAFIAMWLCFYLVWALHSPTYAMYAFLIPYLLLIPVTGLRIYIEHAGTEPATFRDARSYTSPLYTVLLFGNNYHLEHHLYPSVPSYKLPRVHERLAATGLYKRHGSPIARGILEPWRYTIGKFGYPNARLRQLSQAQPQPRDPSR